MGLPIEDIVGTLIYHLLLAEPLVDTALLMTLLPSGTSDRVMVSLSLAWGESPSITVDVMSLYDGALKPQFSTAIAAGPP